MAWLTRILAAVVFNHHADHREILAIHSDRFAYQAAVGVVTAPPQSVTENHHAGFPKLFFFRPEVSAKERLDAEYIEKSRRYAQARDLLRFAAFSRGSKVVTSARRVEDRNIFKNVILLRDVQVVGRGNNIEVVRVPAECFPHQHQAIGVGERQLFKDRRIRHREDHGIRSHAERECQYGNGGEAGVLPQLTNAVANIIQKSSHRKALLTHTAAQPSDRPSLHDAQERSLHPMPPLQAPDLPLHTSKDRED